MAFQTPLKKKITPLVPSELKSFMNTHGVSTFELAEILGVSVQAISLWLLGKREISITNTKIILLFNKYPRLMKEF